MEQELIRLIQANKEKFYRCAYSYVKNREDALDIVHDSIVKALQNIDSLHNNEFLETWFYRILINESISFLRKNRKICYMDEFPTESIPQSGEEDREQKLTLYDALDRLSPKYRTVVILRYFEDRKFEEIARITGANVNTVKARLYKALKLLKIDLEEMENAR